MTRFSFYSRDFLILALLLFISILVTVILEADSTDLRLAGSFYTPGGINDGWVHAKSQPWKALYDYGEIVAVGFAVCSAIALFGSMMGKVSRKYAKPCLVVVLTFLLGPGLLINGILKTYWGRPRPCEVNVLGGDQEYRKVWQPEGPGVGKSFTCGHCSVAFAMISAASFFPTSPAAQLAVFFASVIVGVVMGIARMVQGGHFAGDVLWSFVLTIIVWRVIHVLVFRSPKIVDAEKKKLSSQPDPTL